MPLSPVPAGPALSSARGSMSTSDDSRPGSHGFDALCTTMTSDAFAYDDHLSDVAGDALAAKHGSSAAILSASGSGLRSSPIPATPRTPSSSNSPLQSRSSRPRLHAPGSLDRLRNPALDAAWTPPRSITSQARQGNRVTSWTTAAAALGERPPDSISQNSVSNRLKVLHSGQFGRARVPRPNDPPGLSCDTQDSPSPTHASPSPFPPSPSPASAPPVRPRPSAADILAQPGTHFRRPYQPAPRSAPTVPATAPAPAPEPVPPTWSSGGSETSSVHPHMPGPTQRTILPANPGRKDQPSPLASPEHSPGPALDQDLDRDLDHDQDQDVRPTRGEGATHSTPPTSHRLMPSASVSGLGISFGSEPELGRGGTEYIPASRSASGAISNYSVRSDGPKQEEKPEVIVDASQEHGPALDHDGAGQGHARTSSTATANRSPSSRHLRNRSSRYQSENRLSTGGHSHASGAGTKRASRFSFFGVGGGDKSARGGTENAARKSFNRASVLLRRSVGKLLPGLGLAPPPGEAGAKLGSSDNLPTTLPSGSVEMANISGPKPYAAHMQPPCSGPVDALDNHPRAQWSEWNLAPTAPGTRFWHRFSLAVQHEPEWASARGTQSTREGGLTWLSDQRKQTKRFRILLIVAFVLLVCIVIAAAVGGSLAGHNSKS